MQRIGVDITEREAYEAYVLHLKAYRCACAPGIGFLCADGTRLHAEWRDAEQREQSS